MSTWVWRSLLIILVLFLIDRLGLWAEQKGFIYWRYKQPSSSGFGNALAEFQAFLSPSAKNIVQVSEKKDIQQKAGQAEGNRVIRLANLNEVDLLSGLSVRSKAFWPYDESFINDCVEDLKLDPIHIENKMVYLIEQNAKICGFYAFSDPADPEMSFLFVEPELIGKGFGYNLWQHAIGFAAKKGWPSFKIIAEPYAEKFYRRVGCKKIGEQKSVVRPGRMLPVLRYVVR